MHITIEAPRQSEANVVMDSEQGSMTIEPHFSNAIGGRCIAYVTVRGQGGTERRYSLIVSGKNGRMTATEYRDVETEFDRAKPGGGKQRGSTAG